MPKRNETETLGERSALGNEASGSGPGTRGRANWSGLLLGLVFGTPVLFLFPDNYDGSAFPVVLFPSVRPSVRRNPPREHTSHSHEHVRHGHVCRLVLVREESFCFFIVPFFLSYSEYGSSYGYVPSFFI